MSASPDDTKRSPAGGPAWRVLTWNVRGSHRPDLGDLADVVRRYAPDVVALQEVWRGQAGRLAGALGWHHVWARKHHPWSPLVWWRTEGLAILSPSPLASPVHRTISTGVSTWTYGHRIVLAATVQRGPGDELRVYDTHLASDRDADARIVQARRVADLVATEGAPHRVVAGDLNDEGEPEVVRELHRVGLRDVDGGSTNPAIAPRQRLDHVVIPAGAVVVEQHEPAGGEEWAELSDHLPVLVAFRLP